LRRSVPLALTLVAALAGCQEPEPTPEDAAARFGAYVRAGQLREVWGLLTEASRAELSARHQALLDAQGRPAAGAAPDPVEILNSFGLSTLGAAKAPVIASPLGEHVVVRVAGPRGSADLHLRREDGAWKVDLMRSLAPVDTSTVTPPPGPPG
jgi:hypothetical protein